MSNSKSTNAGRTDNLFACCVGEFVGTFVLVFLGCGIVHSAVLYDSVSGIWQIAIVWALAITIAIYSCSRFSDAHFNPAVTLAFAVWRKLDWFRVLSYWCAQFAGAFCAAATLFAIYSERITQYESENQIERGSLISKVSARMYGEFTPNPETISFETPFDESAHAKWEKTTSLKTAFLAEAAGTAMLAFVIFAFSDARGMLGNRSEVAALMIGLTVGALICLLAPITQAGFNPARDFGPRLFAFFAGWGDVVFNVKGGLGWFTIYIVGPMTGGVVGGGVHLLLSRLPSKAESADISRSPIR